MLFQVDLNICNIWKTFQLFLPSTASLVTLKVSVNMREICKVRVSTDKFAKEIVLGSTKYPLAPLTWRRFKCRVM